MVCYLHCKGYKEVDIGFNENTKKVYFVYEDNKEINEAIDKYKDIDTLVNLHQFITEFKKLKDEVYKHNQHFK